MTIVSKLDLSGNRRRWLLSTIPPLDQELGVWIRRVGSTSSITRRIEALNLDWIPRLGLEILGVPARRNCRDLVRPVETQDATQSLLLSTFDNRSIADAADPPLELGQGKRTGSTNLRIGDGLWDPRG